MSEKLIYSRDEDGDGVKAVPGYLKSFQLDTKSIAERQFTIGGSDANIIASGNETLIMKLFQEKTGQIDRDDLTTVWPVIMGHVTEELNKAWFEYIHQLTIEDYQRVIRSKKHPFMRCTLDGWIRDWNGAQAVWDAKFTMGRPKAGESWSDVIPRLVRQYSPQLHHNGYCLEEATGKRVKYGILSIIRGGDQPQTQVIELDREYTEYLIGLEKSFINSVETGLPPVIPEPEQPPVPKSDRIEYNMTESKKALDWQRHADVWKQTFGAAQSFKDAEAAIKKLVPKDASTATGSGITVKVSANNAKRIELE